MRTIKELEDSRLFQQLEKFPAQDKVAQAALAANVRQVVGQAEWISSRVSVYLKQYTLHERTHLFNVLSLMEELLPESTSARLTPLECALCILAAFTHDLGMALSEEEHKLLYDDKSSSPERRDFVRFREERFPSEQRQIERLRKMEGDNAPFRASLIEGHILAEYIRVTHADRRMRRLRSWFQKIKQTTKNEAVFRYGNTDFEDDLILIDVSHNQETHWLREELIRRRQEAIEERQDDAFHVLVMTETVNLAFPGLLLRLADYIDFDATRAPSILFHHFGIEDVVSVQEWQKHMAIKGWKFLPSNEPEPELLRYEALDCPHPVCDKTIRDFVAGIDREVRRVRDELRLQNRFVDPDYELRLPDKVEARVVPARDKGRPRYIYQDMKFELDQHEILQLLMGESLYGDPSLCLRELVQNSLDALQMRQLRLDYKARIEQDRSSMSAAERNALLAEMEPTDSLVFGEELGVDLTWGVDDKTHQEYIRVRDNGSGMTRRVLETFFTRLGKSYYRSPEFEREQARLRSHRLFATPISHFGIGILSCFMIADWMEVRTRPGGAGQNDPNRAPYDVTISGPGSLFWLKPGTLETQGTEITLYLKPKFRLAHDRDTLIERLRIHFGYQERETQKEEAEVASDAPRPLDPAFIVAQHVLWPLFPIRMGGANVPAPICLNDRFHLDVLYPIDVEAVAAKAAEWNCPKERLGDLHWATYDWVDDADPVSATGCRIRLAWVAHFAPETTAKPPMEPPSGSGLCRLDEILSFVETTIKGSCTRCMVKGIAVSDDTVVSKDLPIGAGIDAGIGSRLWVDLRGTAAPRLTADRRKALARPDGENWKEIVRGVFARWARFVQSEMERVPETDVHWLTLIQWSEDLRPRSLRALLREWRLVPACLPSWTQGTLDWETALWRVSQYKQEAFLVLDLARDRALARDLARNRFALAHDLARSLALNLDLARDLAHARARNRLAPDLDLDRALAFTITLNLARVRLDTIRQDLERFHSYIQCLLFDFFADAFQPSLERSYPLLGCSSLSGQVGDGLLTAPGILQFQLGADECTLQPADVEGKEPAALAAFGYDLVFPLSSVPLGALRCNCPDWRNDRWLRPLGVLPFLAPGIDKDWEGFASQFQKRFRVDRFYALLPDFRLWDIPFADWTPEDWKTCGLSALWDLAIGTVLWADGAHSVEEMRTIGLPFEQFIQSAE